MTRVLAGFPIDIEILDCGPARLLLSYKNKRGSIRVYRRVTVGEGLMKRLMTLVIVLACGVTAVLADTDPIAERRALMKHDGEAAKKLFDMSKGKIPFDLATVKASLKTLNEGATKSRQQQDRRRHCGPAGDLGEQG